MTVGLNNTALLSLPLPVEGYFDGTWGDLVNYALTDYLDIAIAGTLTLTGDGAVTLANTAGDDAATNITATSAQYAVIKIAGTLTTTKVITAPSTSKTYIIDNTATGGTVTFKASGQTGVSIAVAEKCVVYFNGTDYVKVASSVVDGVSTISFGSTGLTPATATSGAVTVAGTLAVANGGTGVTTSTGTGNVVLSTSPTLVTPALGTPSSGVATNLTGLPLTTGVTGILPVANGGNGTATPALTQGSNVTITGTWPNYTISASAPGTGTVTSVAGTGTVNGISLSGTVTSSGSLTLGGALSNVSLTSQVTGTLPVANGGTGTTTPSLVQGSNITITGTWPNQTIAANASTSGQYQAVASGALANGSKVIVNADGTVSAINSDNQAIGTAATFSGNQTYNDDYAVSIAYDSTNDKLVAVYESIFNSTIGCQAVVGTVTGTSISWGTPVTFVTNGSILSAVFDASTGKVVIAYSISGASQAIVGTVSGTSISFGTAVTFSASSSTSISAVYDSVNAKVVIAYRDGSTNYGTAIVGTVSGTSISFGTAVTFAAANTNYVSAVYTGSKVVISYTPVSTGYGTSIVGTVSGTSISFGTAVTFNAASTRAITSTYDTTNSKVVLAYGDVGNSDYGTAIVGTVSGTSISFGTEVVFNAAFTAVIGIAYSPFANRVSIAWTGTSSIAGTVSGTSISFGSPLTGAVYRFRPVIVYNSGIQKVAVAYQSNSADGYGAAQILTIGFTNLTATNYIGISDAAYANGATATIQTVGSVDDAQTGLTPGLAYYVQTDGTLSTTAGSPSVFAGTAVAATKILVKG